MWHRYLFIDDAFINSTLFGTDIFPISAVFDYDDKKYTQTLKHVIVIEK